MGACVGQWSVACSVLALACSNSGTTPDAGDDSAIITEAGTDAVVDASSDAATGCAAYKYCEDFESYPAGPITNGMMLGPWKATVNGMGIVAQIDAVKPYRGKQSMHVTMPSNAGQDAGTTARGTLNQAATAGLISGNNVFGRAMIFYSDTGGNGLPLAVHSWLFSSAGTSTFADGGVNMNMGGGGAKMQLNYHPVSPLPEQSVQGGTMTTGMWHCLQWEYDGSGSPPANAGKVWVDGTLAVNVLQSQGWNFATPWSTFDFGFNHYQALPNGVDVYLDEFALDGAMIPCPP